MFGRVTGSVQNLKHHLAHFESLTVVQPPRAIAKFGTSTGKEFNLGARRKFADATHVIVVLMGVGNSSFCAWAKYPLTSRCGSNMNASPLSSDPTKYEA